LKNGIHGSQHNGGNSLLVTNPCAPASCAAWIIMGTVGKIFLMCLAAEKLSTFGTHTSMMIQSGFV
jgi:hypothetical protein